MRNIDSTRAAKTLGSLLGDVLAGEEYTITRYGKPIARLVPVRARAHDTIVAAPTAPPVVINSTKSWAERQPEQQGRDQILNAMNTKPRKEDIPK